MTFLPAEKFKLQGRGQIAVGSFADIAIIDLKKIKDIKLLSSSRNNTPRVYNI